MIICLKFKFSLPELIDELKKEKPEVKKADQKLVLHDKDLQKEWDEFVREEWKMEGELLSVSAAGRALIGKSNF